MTTSLKIDPRKKFPHLPGAPIVEAVIHWRARPEREWDPSSFQLELAKQIPDYPRLQEQRELAVGGEFSAETASVSRKSSWQGFRFESSDKKSVAQFTRNGFVFSRLSPYENWEKFEEEAVRLWHVYKDLAEPTEVERLGVRFINVIEILDVEALRKVLVSPPASPLGEQLVVQGFMHQTRFGVPGHPYVLNVIQTIQPPIPGKTARLILDLDVTTNAEAKAEIDDEHLRERLLEMRWIKNEAFFNLITSAAIDRFKGDGR